jgi:hypothetical protein
VELKASALARRVKAQSSWWRAAEMAILHPRKAWDFFRRSGSRQWIDALFATNEEHNDYANELEQSRLLEELLGNLRVRFSQIQGNTSRGNAYTSGAMLSAHLTHLYAIIRKLRPTTVVETGVCNGLSSAIVLAALTRNVSGHLYSIDLPEYANSRQNDARFWIGKGGAVVPENEQSGWLVPPRLREHWTLSLGKSSELLPALLATVGDLDLFIHDSEHSFQNQLFEFRTAFNRLRNGGIIFASDINWSRAFDVFSKEVSDQSRRFFVDYSLGLVVRN